MGASHCHDFGPKGKTSPHNSNLNSVNQQAGHTPLSQSTISLFRYFFFFLKPFVASNDGHACAVDSDTQRNT